MGTSPTVSEWLISPWGGVAYLDLRGGELTFDDAERLLEVVQFYYRNRQVGLLISTFAAWSRFPPPWKSCSTAWSSTLEPTTCG